MRTTAALLALGTFGFLGVAPAGEEGWKKLENPSFSFSVPSTFKKTEASGIDSFVEEYVADGIVITFDYGIYSNDFGGWPKETQFETLTVDGKAARVGTAAYELHKGYSYATQIHIKLEGRIALSMFAGCKSLKEVALAKKIFKTIAFRAKEA